MTESIIAIKTELIKAKGHIYNTETKSVRIKTICFPKSLEGRMSKIGLFLRNTDQILLSEAILEFKDSTQITAYASMSEAKFLEGARITTIE